MKKKIESIAYATLIAILGQVMINQQPQSLFYFSMLHWICTAATLLIARYWISPALRQKKYKKAPMVTFAALVIFYCISAYFFRVYLLELMGQSNITVSLVAPVIVKEVLPPLIAGYGVGCINLLNWKNVRVRKWKEGIAMLAVAALLVYGGMYWIKASYNGNSKIKILNEGKSFTSLDAILDQPELRNKIVYIDVWGTWCGPCLYEFQNYTQRLTGHYAAAGDIAFLYICIDSHPLAEMRWKDRIKSYQPQGYHALVKADGEAAISTAIFGQALEGKYFPYVPCYLIIGKDGKIVDRPAIDESNMELKPSDTTILYAKLDSLRRL